MTKKNTLEETAAVESAAAGVAALESKFQTVDQEFIRAQALAIALPGRLAAGDQTVTTADLIAAGPAVAVAEAKVAAVGRELAAARQVLEQARAAELVARLRSGEPFLTAEQVDADLDRISAYVSRELAKLGDRIDTHNQAFHAVVGSLPRGGGYAVEGGLSVHHDHNGKTIELDGAQWYAMSTDGWGRDVLSRVELIEAQARDAASIRLPLFSSGEEREPAA